jgi:hypothetical protein
MPSRETVELRAHEEEVARAREGWPTGPWTTEPDRVEWRSHGLPCLIVRSVMGNLCGYVGVPPGHRLHGVHYDAVEDVRAHGGITYSNKCCGGICHVPKPGEPADVWWFGFDCAHAFDVVPGVLKYAKVASGTTLKGTVFEGTVEGTVFEGIFGHGVYRDVAYVRACVEAMAAELAEKDRRRGRVRAARKTRTR